jgi:tape measure domain-containing protein
VTTVATLGVDVNTNADAASRALDALSSHFDKATGSAGKMATQFGVSSALAEKAFDMIASAATRAFSAVSNVTIGMSSNLEQANVAFTKMLGSEEAAASMLKDLQQFANATPFRFPELVESSQKLLSFKFTASEIIPLMTAIGDAVAATGGKAENIEQVTRALGQMNMRGITQAEEMNQLIDAGVNSWGMLAKELNVDVATAMKKVEAGTVSADAMMNAFVKGSASEFGGMMEAQSKTMAGAWSSIIDTLQTASTTAFQPLYGIIRKGVVAVNEFTQSDQFTAWSGKVGASIATLTPTFERILGFLSENGPRAMELFGAAIDTATHIIDGASNNWNTFTGKLESGVTTTLAPLQAFKGIFEAVGHAIDTFTTDADGTIIPLGDRIAGVFTDVIGPAMDSFQSFWQGAWQEVQIQTVNAINVVEPILENVRTWLQDNLGPAIEGFRSGWSEAWDTIGPAVTGMWNVVGPILAQLEGAMLGGMIAAVQTVAANWKSFFAAIGEGFNKLGSILKPAADAIGGATKEWVDGMVVEWQSMKEPVAEAAAETAEAARNEIIKGIVPTTEAVAETGKKAAAGLNKAATEGLRPFASNLAAGASQAKALDDAIKKLLESTQPASVAQGMWQKSIVDTSDALAKALPLHAAYLTAAKNSGDVEQILQSIMQATNTTRDQAIVGISNETLTIQASAVAQRSKTEEQEKARTAALGGAIAMRAYAESQEAAKEAELGGAIAIRAHNEDLDKQKVAALGGEVAIRSHNEELEREKVAALGGHLAIQSHNDDLEREKTAALGGQIGIRAHSEALEDEKVAALGGRLAMQAHNDEREREQRTALGGEVGIRAHAEQLEQEKTAALGGEVAIRSHSEALERNKVAALGGATAVREHAASLQFEAAQAGTAADKLEYLTNTAMKKEQERLAGLVLSGQLTRNEMAKQLQEFQKFQGQTGGGGDIFNTPKITMSMAGAFSGPASQDYSAAYKAGQSLAEQTQQGITDEKNDTFAAAQAVGQAASDGMAQGVYDNKGAIIGAMEGVIEEAVRAAKEAAGIASPSKVAAAQIGIPLAQGVASGIMQGMTQARSVMSAGISGIMGLGEGGPMWGDPGTTYGPGGVGFGGRAGPVPARDMANAKQAVAELTAGIKALEAAAEAARLQNDHRTEEELLLKANVMQRNLAFAQAELAALEAEATAFGTVGSAANGAAQEARAFSGVVYDVGEAFGSAMLSVQDHWDILQKRADALIKGVSYTGFGNQTTPVGLNTTQIYGGTSQMTPGSSYYGVPIVSPITPNYTSNPTPTPTGLTYAQMVYGQNQFAAGGTVNEPVYGYGRYSGQSYSFGEQGPETVTPGAGGQGEVHLHFHIESMPLGIDSPSTMRTVWDGITSRWVIPSLKRAKVLK